MTLDDLVGTQFSCFLIHLSHLNALGWGTGREPINLRTDKQEKSSLSLLANWKPNFPTVFYFCQLLVTLEGELTPIPHLLNFPARLAGEKIRFIGTRKLYSNIAKGELQSLIFRREIKQKHK